MIRSVYATLVRLHPPAFRQRFGEEMLSILDQSSGGDRSALMGDAGFSLLRQWLLRPEFREPENTSREYAAGAPMFLVLDDEPRLTRRQWIAGLALASFSFVSASFLISHGGNPARIAIGSRQTSEFGVRVRSNVPTGTLDAEVGIQSAKLKVADARPRFIARYFQQLTVLGALDLDHDLILSESEIANATRALQSLDTNHDGVLDAKECGGFCGSPEVMRRHPVLDALDTDHDGVLSREEISNAPAALRRLDTNHDGSLTADEFLPAHDEALGLKGK